MKLYCGFKLDEHITAIVHSAMDAAKVEAPLELAPKDRVHVTTAFLGEMEVERGLEILKAAANISNFYCYVGGPSSWPGILYLKVNCEGARQVRDKQAATYEKLVGRALWPRDYVPHVTLAKAEKLKSDCTQQVQDACNRILTLNPGSFLVQQLCLFHKSECLETINLPEPLF